MTGYSGYLPSSAIPPPEMKPGETLESRDNKFAGAAELYAKKLTNDYQAPPMRFKEASYAEKPCSNLTTSRAAFCAKDTKGKNQYVPDWISETQESHRKVHGQPVKSSYQMDLDTDPQQRPYLYKNGMATTSLDLCAGSVRSTYHIPGYSGFIPKNTNNLSGKFCDGHNARLKPSTLRLYHRHDLPGYTGYIPEEAVNDKGPRLTGANPKTTSGAGGEILI